MFDDQNKIFDKNNFVLFQSAQTFYGKREGSGSVCGSASGSVLVTNGSGRPKNIRIRIRNTAGSGSAVRKARIKGDPTTLESTNFFNSKPPVVEMGEGT
jgi:hypothetical protein